VSEEAVRDFELPEDFMESLDRLAEELEEKTKALVDKVHKIRINTTHWLDDYNGKSEWAEIHGFLLDEKDNKKLYEIIKTLLELCELEVDGFRVYACVEHGIAVAGHKAVYNPYGSWVGDDHFLYSVRDLVERAKEIKRDFNMETLRNAVERLLSSLS